MNIFMLDYEPRLCARYHTDVHTRKMLLEYAQILSTCQNEASGYYAGQVYKTTHVNHPSVRWAMEGTMNYNWLYSLWQELAFEYFYRFDKAHKTWLDLKDKLGVTPNLPDCGTPLKLAMPEEYKGKDPVQSYRNYYMNAKKEDKRGRSMFVWTRREVPEWITEIV